MQPLLFDDFELLGHNVLLRPLALADAAELAAASGEARDHYGFTAVPEGLDGAHAYIERALRQRAAGERFAFAIVWRGRVVGTTSYYEYQPWSWPDGSPLQRRTAPDTLEIGHTWLAASAQRTGCNTAAKFLLFQHAFEHWHVHALRLQTDERNQRSRTAIARLGCKFEGLRRAHKPGADGTVRTSAYFSVVAAEWPAVREHLLALLTRAEPAPPSAAGP